MRKLCLLIGLLVLFAGCVTVNLYVTFSQEKLDKAAQMMELDIRKDKPAVPSGPAKDGRSSAPDLRFWEPSLLYAQTGSSEPKTTSPAIDEAKARREARYNDIQGFKLKGAVGENRDGLLDILPGVSLSGSESGQLKKLVTDENRDRMVIYQEFVRINNMAPSDLKKVQATFGKVQRKMAAPGEMIQADDRSWSAKR